MESRKTTQLSNAVLFFVAALLLVALAPQIGPLSGAAHAQLLPMSSQPGCMQSLSTTWSNTPLPVQLAPFTATYDATPSQAKMDGVVGFSGSAVSDYTGLAVIARFSSAGVIDAMNGSA